MPLLVLSPTRFNWKIIYIYRMNKINFKYHAQFFTATILEWKKLLVNDECKEIIMNSLKFLHQEKSIIVYSFVIMPNHLHIIWQIQDEFEKEKIQMRFLKYTAQQIKFYLSDNKQEILNDFLVNARDRKYQFWERNSLSIDLWNEKIFIQKLNYIHKNPCKQPWNLSKFPEDYKYSSARSYETEIDDFGFLEHVRG